MNSKLSRVVYTANFGNYDLIPKIKAEWNCDFICFTDNPNFSSPGWKIVVVHIDDESASVVNRRYKILPHIYLNEYELSLYVDGNINIVNDPTELFEKYLATNVMAIPKHQDRTCAYEESIICINTSLANKEVTEKQMLRYKAEGFPANFGMTENNIIFRQHNDKTLILLMNNWWTEYCNGGKRDQLSLPFLIWKSGVKVLECTEGPRVSNKFFEIELHQKDKSKSFVYKFAKKVAAKKYLGYHYLLASKIISFVLLVRDRL